MKKLILFVALMAFSFVVFAQTDSTYVPVVQSGLTLVFDQFGSFISSNVWSVIGLVALILSEILPFTKWKSNGIIQAVLNFFIKKKA